MTISALELAFQTASKNKFQNMRIRYKDLVFSLASSRSMNPGAIYVKNTTGNYYGKIKQNIFHEAPGCQLDLETRSNIRYTMDNPMLAATAYGQRTGNCSICGRTLRAEDSIERKIGPICAEKFGFFELIEKETKDDAVNKTIAEIVSNTVASDF